MQMPGRFIPAPAHPCVAQGYSKVCLAWALHLPHSAGEKRWHQPLHETSYQLNLLHPGTQGLPFGEFSCSASPKPLHFRSRAARTVEPLGSANYNIRKVASLFVSSF